MLQKLLTDEQLMLRYRDGDAQAFDTLYQRYQRPLYSYFYRQCGNSAIAEELYQDIWMNLIRARERYEVTAKFKTYIYRLAHNRLIDHYRKNSRATAVSYEEQIDYDDALIDSYNAVTPERKYSGEQMLQTLVELIESLPEEQKEAFILKEESGMSIDEIAEVTQVKAETAKSRVRYAFNKIRKGMDEQYGD